MQLSGVRPSVCPICQLHAAAVGLLLWARKPGDIDRLLHGAGGLSVSSSRTAANAGSATSSAKGRGWAQTD